MIGTEKLSSIRKRLRDSAGMDDRELEAWFNDRLAQEKKKSQQSDAAIEALSLFRDALLKETKRSGRRKPKTQRKAASRK